MNSWRQQDERKGNNLYANVPFEKDMKIFESGVNYFK